MKGLSIKQIGTIIGAIIVVGLVSTYFEPLKATLRVKEQGSSKA
jgi:hypothetical protein